MIKQLPLLLTSFVPLMIMSVVRVPVVCAAFLMLPMDVFKTLPVEREEKDGYIV